MNQNQNISRVMYAVKKHAYRLLAISAIFIGGMSSLSAQTCVQTLAGSGTINSGSGTPSMGVTLSPTCQGAGVITGITMDGIVGGGCGISFESRVYVNGVLIPHPGSPGFGNCGFTGYDLTSYLPITSVTYEVYTFSFTNVTVSFSMNLNVTYSANFCTGVPSSGTVVASTPVICAGDTVDLTLSGQTAALGIEYQWQSSLDNNVWTDMIDDTLFYASTTLNNNSYYRCVSTCTYSGLSDTSTVDSVLLGFCTPFSDTTCSYNAGPTSINISIPGWQGMPLSDGIITFEYKGSLNQPTAFLTVTDALGNTYGQLDGSQLFCADHTDELPITLSQINSLLTAGNGNIDLTVSASSSLGAWCPTSGGDASFCMTASLRAATHIYADDASAGLLINPSAGSCILDSNVSVGLVNTGSNTLTSAQINWSVNGIVQLPLSWTGSIASFVEDTVVVGLYVGGFTNYDTLLVWPTLPNGSIDSSTVSDTLTSIVHDALNGVYTIAQNGSGDFTTFTEALLAMESFGICGPVVFEAVDLSYVEQLIINTSNIVGVNSLNTITFRSQSGDPDDVQIAFSPSSSADNYVVMLNNSQYVSFEDLTIKSISGNYLNSRVLFTPLSGNNQYIRFENCILETPYTSNSTGNAICYVRGADNENWSFVNNKFVHGSYGLYFGDSNPNGNGDYGDSNSIIDNEFLGPNSYGIYLTRQHNLIVKGNHITAPLATTSSSTYGINMSNIDGVGEISDNHVTGSVDWPKYGMYIGALNGDPSNLFPIYNNRIYVPGNNSARGMYLYDVNHADIAHNSVFKHGAAGTFNSALMLSSSDSNYLRNNIFQLSGVGFAMYVSGSGTPIISSDYNNLSINDTAAFTGYYQGDSLTTLSSWVAFTNFDSNSLSVQNVFSDTSSLLVCTDSLYGKGTFLPAYPMDLDGDPRQNPPCIGADEFMPLSQIGFPSNVELCDGDTLVLTQYYYETVIWDFLDTTNTITIFNPGSHSVSVHGTCGSDTSAFTVIPQQYAFVGDSNLCEGTSAVLNTGIPNGTYAWSNGTTDSVVTVDSAQVISVYVVSEFGCVSSDTATITQSTDVNLALDTNILCEGSNVVLNADMAGSYEWSDGSTNQTLSVTTPGVYYVTVTELNCMSSDSTVVTEVLNVIPSFTEAVNVNTVTFSNTTQYATSYSWDFGDGNTSNLENPVHTYSPSSSTWTYTVTLTATNDCGDNEFVSEVSNEPNSVSDIELTNSVRIYPNPTDGIFNVEISDVEPGELKLEVLDIRGAVMYSESYANVQGETIKSINISNLSNGVYLVRVTLNNRIALFKMTKN